MTSSESPDMPLLPRGVVPSPPLNSPPLNSLPPLEATQFAIVAETAADVNAVDAEITPPKLLGVITPPTVSTETDEKLRLIPTFSDAAVPPLEAGMSATLLRLPVCTRWRAEVAESKLREAGRAIAGGLADERPLGAGTVI